MAHGGAPIDGAELAALRPYLDLAREIRAEVDRVASDDDADSEALVAAVAAVPDRERARLVWRVFERLDAEKQWEVLARAFADDEIRRYLADEHERRRARATAVNAWAPILAAARSSGRLQLTDLPEDVELRLGLFRPEDVQAAVRRGHRSDTCARLLILRASPQPATFRVVDDAFNPRGGLFVTAQYDEQVWTAERLPDRSTVQVGSLVEGPGGRSLEPCVYAGSPVDLVVGERDHPSRLRLGFAILDSHDVFADPA